MFSFLCRRACQHYVSGLYHSVSLRTFRTLQEFLSEIWHSCSLWGQTKEFGGLMLLLYCLWPVNQVNNWNNNSYENFFFSKKLNWSYDILYWWVTFMVTLLWFLAIILNHNWGAEGGLMLSWWHSFQAPTLHPSLRICFFAATWVFEASKATASLKWLLFYHVSKLSLSLTTYIISLDRYGCKLRGVGCPEAYR